MSDLQGHPDELVSIRLTEYLDLDARAKKAEAELARYKAALEACCDAIDGFLNQSDAQEIKDSFGELNRARTKGRKVLGKTL